MTQYYLNEDWKTFPLLHKTSAHRYFGLFTTLTRAVIINFIAVHSGHTCTTILFIRLLYYYLNVLILLIICLGILLWPVCIVACRHRGGQTTKIYLFLSFREVNWWSVQERIPVTLTQQVQQRIVMRSSLSRYVVLLCVHRPFVGVWGGVHYQA
jgi:hypothetical protein